MRSQPKKRPRGAYALLQARVPVRVGAAVAREAKAQGLSVAAWLRTRVIAWVADAEREGQKAED